MRSPLHAFATAHDGVVTVDVAAALGYDWTRLEPVLRDEGWDRLARGAYLAPATEATLRARVRAQQLRRPALVASHRTAAALHGGDVLVAGFDFLVDGTGRYDVPGGTARQWRLDPGDLVDVGGLRVTSPARTAADLLRALPLDEAVIAVDGLARARLVTLDAVADRLDAAAGRSHIQRAWRAYRLLDPASGSVAESKARLVMAHAGLLPRTQVVLVDRAGRRVRVDFLLGPVVIEIEGYAYHSTRDQHAADIARFNELARLPGCSVLRFSRADVFERPRAMVATIRAALRRYS